MLSHGSKNHGPTMPSTITSDPPRAYRFAASKKASMTTKFCSLDSGKCGGIAPLLK